MLDYLLHRYGDIALYLLALLEQYLPNELATVLALTWPGYVCLIWLALMSALFTWQDRRTLNRHLNRRLAQLHKELDEQGR